MLPDLDLYNPLSLPVIEKPVHMIWHNVPRPPESFVKFQPLPSIEIPVPQGVYWKVIFFSRSMTHLWRLTDTSLSQKITVSGSISVVIPS